VVSCLPAGRLLRALAGGLLADREVRRDRKEVGIRLGEGQGGASGTSGARVDAVTDARLTRNPLHPVFVDMLPKTEVVRLSYNVRDEELNTTFHQVSTPLWTGERQPDDAFFTELNDAVQSVLDKPRP